MDNTLLMYIGFDLSLIAFGLAARWYLAPWMRRVSLVDAATPILLLHTLRHMGMVYLNDAVVPGAVPAAFASPTAWGDLATAVLALIALAALRSGWPQATALLWTFNIVGFADLGLAAINAARVDLLAYEIGAAYYLPVIVVPLLLVTHVALAWRMSGARRDVDTNG